MDSIRLAALALSLLAATACARGGTQTTPVPWDSITSDRNGTEFAVTYTSGACQRFHHIEVDEGEEEVVVTVYDEVERGECIALGVLRDVTVSLDEPLNGREIVDGACQMPEFSGYTACTETADKVAIPDDAGT